MKLLLLFTLFVAGFMRETESHTQKAAAKLTSSFNQTIYPEAQDFKQIGQTTTTVDVSWEMDITQYTPSHYTITIDGDQSSDYPCYEQFCNFTVLYLDACNIYSLFLLATYDDGGTNIGSTTGGETAYEEPLPVTNLEADEQMVTWTASFNEQCVGYYEFCYDSSITPADDCRQIEDTAMDMYWLSGCDELEITVTPVSGGQEPLRGESSTTDTVISYGVPSVPLNMDATSLSETSVFVVWDWPLENPACIVEFIISIGPVDEDDNRTVFYSEVRSEVNSPKVPDMTATLTDLAPCTNYSITVAARSIEQEIGEAALDYQSTDYITPQGVPNVTITPGTDYIEVTWDNVEQMFCLEFIQICYADSVELENYCFQISDLGDGSYILEGLEPCRIYHILVIGMSDIGDMGPPFTDFITTLDAAPGPVLELKVVSAEPEAIAISYNEPSINVDCAAKYVVSHVNMLDDTDTPTYVIVNGRGADHVEIITRLEPCGLYKIEVYAESLMGLVGNSSVVEVETDAMTPESPRNPEVLDITETSMTLTWASPEQRFCVDSYLVNFINGNETVSTVLEAVDYPMLVMHTFDDLVSCVEYTIEISSGNYGTGRSPFITVGTYMTVCQP